MEDRSDDDGKHDAGEQDDDEQDPQEWMQRAYDPAAVITQVDDGQWRSTPISPTTPAVP